MLLGNVCICCDECQCLDYQDGNYQLNPHVRFDSNAFAVQLNATRQADPTLWKGFAGDSPGPGRTTGIHLRVPTSGRPRLLFLFDEPNSLTSADFDALGARKGCLFECRNNTLIDLRSVAAGQTVTINGLVFTAHATTTTPASRQFAIGGSNTADATALATCINDPTHGVPGVAATTTGTTVFGRVRLTPSVTATTAASTITIHNEIWQLLESNDFTYLGESVTANMAAVDGVASQPLVSPVATDKVWCNPSYVPATIECTFANWSNDGSFRRANFNGVPMSLALTGTVVSGSRTIRNYGWQLGPTPAFYSDAPVGTCAGGHPNYPAGTLRWRLRAQTNTATVPDGTASQIWVLITEDQVMQFSPGCHISFTGDITFGSPFVNGFFKYLSTFDRLDDQPLVTHWIKKANTQTTSSIPDGSYDGTTYWTRTFNWTPSAPPIGTLLKCFP